MGQRQKDMIVNQCMTVQRLGSGYAAVHMVEVATEGRRGTYWDVQQTGIGRYATEAEAEVEARDWSRSDEIPFQQPT